MSEPLTKLDCFYVDPADVPVDVRQLAITVKSLKSALEWFIENCTINDNCEDWYKETKGKIPYQVWLLKKAFPAIYDKGDE